MKPRAITLILLASSLCGCALNFGTIGTWSAEPSPPAALFGTRSVTTVDGMVVFFGGFDQRGQAINQVLIFDPGNDRWSQGLPMPANESGYALAAMSNGSILVAGGGGSGSGVSILPTAGQNATGGAGLLSTTWIFDPHIDVWRRAGDLHVARSGAAATLLTSGKVLIAGGSTPLATPIQLPNGNTEYSGFSSSSEFFDPQTQAWTLTSPMHQARGAMALIPLTHGGAIAAGGCAYANQGLNAADYLTTTELFDPNTSTWSLTSPLPEPRCLATGVSLRDGRALLTGGTASSVFGGSLTDAFLFDERNRAWATAGTTVPGASAPVLLSDGRVFVAAAQNGPIKGPIATLTLGGQVFDPSSGDWTFVTSIAVEVPSRSLGPVQNLTVAAQPADTGFVLLTAPGLAYRFHPSGAVPPVVILDSPGLVALLIGLVCVLGLWLGIDYLRARRRERPPTEAP